MTALGDQGDTEGQEEPEALPMTRGLDESNPMSPSNILRTPKSLIGRIRPPKTSKGKSKDKKAEIQNEMGDQAGGRIESSSRKKQNTSAKVEKMNTGVPPKQKEKAFVLPNISVTPQEMPSPSLSDGSLTTDRCSPKSP